MATIKSKFTDKLSLNVQNDFITLRTPNGNFTTSYRGAKASGKLAAHPTAFMELDKYVQGMGKEKKEMNFTQIMETLLNPKVLATMFKEWDEAQTSVSVGDTVTFENPIFLKKYPQAGEVKSVKRKTAFVKFPNGETCGFDMAFLVKV